MKAYSFELGFRHNSMCVLRQALLRVMRSCSDSSARD
jgi:hypothetical protein